LQGDAVAKNSPAYAISDDLSIAENLEAFVSELKTIDPKLADAIKTSLAPLAAGQKVDVPAVLNALFKATEQDVLDGKLSKSPASGGDAGE
jgi:hypothetical protein